MCMCMHVYATSCIFYAVFSIFCIFFFVFFLYFFFSVLERRYIFDMRQIIINVLLVLFISLATVHVKCWKNHNNNNNNNNKNNVFLVETIPATFILKLKQDHGNHKQNLKIKWNGKKKNEKKKFLKKGSLKHQ